MTTTSSWSGSTTRTSGSTATTRCPRPAADDVTLTMGLLHAPYQRVLDAMVADGASVVLAGHTHGGQLALPVWGALVTNCDLDTRRGQGPVALVARRGLLRAGRRRCALVAGSGGCRVAARLGRARHLAVRSGALRLPAGGHPAHPGRPRLLSTGVGPLSGAGRAGLDRFQRAGAGRLSSGVAAPRARRHSHGVWRSLVARVVRDDEAAGSNPVTPTADRRALICGNAIRALLLGIPRA